MTTATHTLSNGAVIAIDLDRMPKDAHTITADEYESCKWTYWVGKETPHWDGLNAWETNNGKDHYANADDMVTLISGTLPPWSECIIDLEEVRRAAKLNRLTAEAQANGEYDDGPARLYDIVECAEYGTRRWVVGATETEIGGYFFVSGCGECVHAGWVENLKGMSVIARNVYDIREAMRLMGETDA